MPFTLTMPKLSPTMSEGTIAKWRKKEGEFVEDSEILLEVATDKATVEHAVLDGGWIRKILVFEGQEAQVNQAIAIFTKTKDETIEGYIPEGLILEEKIVGKEKLDTSLPDLKTTQGQPQISTKSSQIGLNPAAFEIAPSFDINQSSSIDDRGRVKASPLARKIAKEKSLDITTVQGTGPSGLVTSKDLELAQVDVGQVFGSKKKPQDLSGSYEDIALTPVRKVIAERLQQAKTFIPHFYVSLEIDAEPIVALRDELKATGIKLTFNDFIVKASALALKKHPEVNSGFNVVNNSIIGFKTIDISIAVSVEGGLITPIVRHADFKNLGEISQEVKNLADKARLGKLQLHEYKGGSFTLSNLGMYGINTFTAIINPPQAAILAIGGILDKPVVRNGAVVAGKTISLTLSADHRVIDGAIAAQFLKTIQNFLEHPSILLVH
jgi:pyruvate dehydrogenase E2 component (dihydrolipoamide acetyltransferase)